MALVVAVILAMGRNADDAFPPHADGAGSGPCDSASIRLSLELIAAAIRVLDYVLHLGEDGDGDVEEVLRAGIAQAPQLAGVGVELPAGERVLVLDVDEAAAGDVANPDLDGPPRNVHFVAVVELEQVVHRRAIAVVVRGLALVRELRHVLGVVVHDARVEVLLPLEPDRHAGAVHSRAASRRVRLPRKRPIARDHPPPLSRDAQASN